MQLLFVRWQCWKMCKYMYIETVEHGQLEKCVQIALVQQGFGRHVLWIYMLKITYTVTGLLHTQHTILAWFDSEWGAVIRDVPVICYKTFVKNVTENMFKMLTVLTKKHQNCFDIQRLSDQCVLLDVTEYKRKKCLSSQMYCSCSVGFFS